MVVYCKVWRGAAQASVVRQEHDSTLCAVYTLSSPRGRRLLGFFFAFVFFPHQQK